MPTTAQTLQALERKFWQSLVDQDFHTAEDLLDNTAILAYDVKQVVERRDRGGRIEQHMHDTSTWVRNGKGWKCVAHTETPAASAH